ncbi:hypothetical protein ACFV3R_06965 [Streptomyces sp. NPDC059740]|uniref:hypothetical protein n=1 Tax=Streptomyces sp. NPDC059740 TaxID=3346926 RepID=UPI00365B230B
MNEGKSRARRRPWRAPLVAVVVCAAAMTTGGWAADAPPAPVPASARAAGSGPGAPGPVRSGQQYAATTATSGTRTTLRFALDTARGSTPRPLSTGELNRLAAQLGLARGALRPVAPAGRKSRSETAPAAPAAKAPATLRCDRNPSWSDANGTLAARFNCHYSTINWGYRISARVRSVITSSVHESGVSWWRNGHRQPKNAGHVVGASYHFHGTLKPVRHGNHVQFQDYMTFRVRIGGRPGTGSLVWTADVRAKK